MTTRTATVESRLDRVETKVDGLRTEVDGLRGEAVSFCNAYVDRTHPTVREMEEITWVLRTNARRNQVGFVRSSDLKARERFVLSDDWS